MTGISEFNENWYNKTHCFTLPSAKILLKLLPIWKSYKHSKLGAPSLKNRKIYIFIRYRLVKVLRKTDLSEFFSHHLELIDVSSVKISCNLVQRLTRYKRKTKGGTFFLGNLCNQLLYLRNEVPAANHAYIRLKQ